VLFSSNSGANLRPRFLPLSGRPNRRHDGSYLASFYRTTSSSPPHLFTGSPPRSPNTSRISLPVVRCDGLIPLSGVECRWLASCRGGRPRLPKLSADEPCERGEEVMWRRILSRCPAGSDCAGFYNVCAHYAHYERTMIRSCVTLRGHATAQRRTAPA
jgi:hypothetical protein